MSVNYPAGNAYGAARQSPHPISGRGEGTGSRRKTIQAQWMYDANGNLDKSNLVEAYAPLVKRIAFQLMSRLPASVDVDDLIQNGMLGLLDALGRYEHGLGAQFEVRLPGIDRAMAQEIVEAAHQVCPYSKATRNNIEVKLSVVD